MTHLIPIVVLLWKCAVTHLLPYFLFFGFDCMSPFNSLYFCDASKPLEMFRDYNLFEIDNPRQGKRSVSPLLGCLDEDSCSILEMLLSKFRFKNHIEFLLSPFPLLLLEFSPLDLDGINFFTTGACVLSVIGVP
jgi:hypothetical protein